jgi:hypothetical protein
MSLPVAQANKMSVDEYLAGEQDGEFRHEYIDGMVYAMVGPVAVTR